MSLYIYLKNTEQDFSIVKKYLNDFNCEVILEENNLLIITSNLVQNKIDSSDSDAVCAIWKQVKNFLSAINGAIALEDASSTFLELQTIKYESDSGEIKFLPNIGKMNLILPPLGEKKLDPAELIQLALKDKVVAKALRLASRDFDWINLYRIYEIIKEDGYSLPDKEFTTFTASANNSSVSGDDSRHGKMNSKKLKKTMDLTTAKYLIKNTLKQWLHCKLMPTDV